MNTAYLSLGSNLGDKAQNLHHAERLIAERVGAIVQSSGPYATEPWGMESEHEFLNAVLVVHTEHAPLELLRLLQEMERQLGRTRKSSNGHYEDRLIDIDILYYNDLVFSSSELTLPHPLIDQRPFIQEGFRLLGEIGTPTCLDT
jgi:2-amino-4-hydroxy-6-hydroxymethyldihydropteridine diphosphokinase